VAGSGRLPDDLGQAAPPQVEIINKYIPDAEVALLMSRCSIVALPYTSATQSGVVALAQAFERPVVATAVGGLNEMVIQGRTGILVPPDDHVALGRALTSLAGDSKRRSRMRREIRRIAAARWEPRVIATAYLAVYASARTMRR
jgi:glycosyltransferase involved in cell wall biosynthesis